MKPLRDFYTKFSTTVPPPTTLSVKDLGAYVEALWYNGILTIDALLKGVTSPYLIKILEPIFTKLKQKNLCLAELQDKQREKNERIPLLRNKSPIAEIDNILAKSTVLTSTYLETLKNKDEYNTNKEIVDTITKRIPLIKFLEDLKELTKNESLPKQNTNKDYIEYILKNTKMLTAKNLDDLKRKYITNGEILDMITLHKPRMAQLNYDKANPKGFFSGFFGRRTRRSAKKSKNRTYKSRK
jgi:hypothetical protein